MDADVEKAVELIGRTLHGIYPPSAGICDDFLLIRQALRDQDAEIVRLRCVIANIERIGGEQ